jgi:hypothetical protein
MVTDASFSACRCRGGLNGVTVRTGGSEPRRRSLSDRILIATCAALFVSTVSPDSETRIGAAARAPGVDRATVHPPGAGPTPTWTGAPCTPVGLVLEPQGCVRTFIAAETSVSPQLALTR